MSFGEARDTYESEQALHRIGVKVGAGLTIVVSSLAAAPAIFMNFGGSSYCA